MEVIYDCSNCYRSHSCNKYTSHIAGDRCVCTKYKPLSEDPELLSDIEHLEEVLSDPEREWSCEDCRKDHERLLRFLKELLGRRKYGSSHL